MSSNEQALRVARMQVQFELAQAGAAVAQAATLGVRSQRRVDIRAQRCESAAGELRGALAQSRINPALLSAMRRLYQLEQRALHESQLELAAVKQREQQARAVLAGVRNRAHGLDRALQAERRKQQQEQQALEMIEADDMWLQHAWMETR